MHAKVNIIDKEVERYENSLLCGNMDNAPVIFTRLQK